MPLQPPKLDDRTFADLVQEAKARIPRYLPEWTDWNDSDPGITLLQLQAWLTETILYRLNQVPELNYVKFLQLLGVEQRPAKPAEADLTFILKQPRASDRESEILIEKGALVSVSDRDLEAPLFFETDRTLVAIKARLTLMVRVLPGQKTRDVTQANEVDGQTILPFSPDETSDPIQNGALYLGFSSPLPFSRQEFGLQIYLAETGQALLAPPDVSTCGPEPEDESEPQLSWQWWTGTNWEPLDIAGDDTYRLTQSGQIYMRVTGQIPTVPAKAVTSLPTAAPPQLADITVQVEDGTSATLTTQQLQALRNPDLRSSDGLDLPAVTTVEELAKLTAEEFVAIVGLSALAEQNLLKLAEKFLAGAQLLLVDSNISEPPPLEDITVPTPDGMVTRLTPQHLELLRDRSLRSSRGTDLPVVTTATEFTNLTAEDFVAIVGLSALAEQNLLKLATTILAEAQRLPEAPLYYWLRVVYTGGSYAKPPKIDRILTNTVRATAAQTVRDEVVGSSNGNPNQALRLRRRPVLADPPLRLEVDEGSGPNEWTPVSDFYGIGPDETCYRLNRATGQIVFGDGRRGRIPVAGEANVIARHYRYGGGEMGNVGAGTITNLASVIRGVESVTNYRPASGGEDEELLTDTKLRAAWELKTRERAVTLEDFIELAKETPGALVGRATAYATALPGEGVTSAGGGGQQIQVVIVPQSTAAKPYPSEAARRLVCRYLDERRLVTTQVTVTSPEYVDIDIVLEVQGRKDADLKAVKAAIRTRLDDYCHPLRGGPDGSGWPFGQALDYSELIHELMLVEGVLRVQNLKLRRFESAPTATERSTLPEDDIADFSMDPETGVRRRVKVVTPSAVETDPPQVEYLVATVYNRSTLPLGSDRALIALRHAEITITYPPLTYRGSR
jgi:predicted phage baseplate assembly protein